MKLQLNENEILEKKFKKNVKGYDPDEVDAFLDRVLIDYRVIDDITDDLNSQIVNLRRENDSLRANLRKKESEISVQKSKNIVTNEVAKETKGSLDPIDLLEKCSAYEKKLYSLGIDPSKIK